MKHTKVSFMLCANGCVLHAARNTDGQGRDLYTTCQVCGAPLPREVLWDVDIPSYARHCALQYAQDSEVTEQVLSDYFKNNEQAREIQIALIQAATQTAIEELQREIISIEIDRDAEIARIRRL